MSYHDDARRDRAQGIPGASAYPALHPPARGKSTALRKETTLLGEWKPVGGPCETSSCVQVNCIPTDSSPSRPLCSSCNPGGVGAHCGGTRWRGRWQFGKPRQPNHACWTVSLEACAGCKGTLRTVSTCSTYLRCKAPWTQAGVSGRCGRWSFRRAHALGPEPIPRSGARCSVRACTCSLAYRFTGL